jgi:hypothetical protein
MHVLQGFKTFEIGGAERPFHIGTNHTWHFCKVKAELLKERARTDEDREKYAYPLEIEEFNKMYFSGDKETSYKNLAGENWTVLIYSALLAGCDVMNEKPDFTYKQVIAWLDETAWLTDRMIDFINFFYKTQSERTQAVADWVERITANGKQKQTL